MKKPTDTLLLFILVIARIRIDTLADLVLPQRHDDIRRLVASWWPEASLTLLTDWLSDPITQILISLAFGLTLLYFIVDAAGPWLGQKSTFRLKLGLIYAVIIVLVFGKTALLIGLRHITGPAAYTHDGGVIQTESTIEFFLNGKSPYIENYLNTPMAEWGIEYRTALYHYPYLPWTFIFSAPFYLLSHISLGWYDQRMVYLLLFMLTLFLAQGLARQRQHKLMAVMLIGLNPIMGSDVIFGQNDSFILFWLALALWLLQKATHNKPSARKWQLLGAAAFGLACASKSTAWFLAPFWFLYILRDEWGTELIPPPARWKTLAQLLWWRTWPLLVVMIVIIGPWFVWSPNDMIDDVWRWSAGTAEHHYQIRGWGLSNFILAFQLVPDRLAYWPFWITEIMVAAPLLLLGLWRQIQYNTSSQMCYNYTVLLLGFFYASRFLNENYLGYLAAFIALAFTMSTDQPDY